MTGTLKKSKIILIIIWKEKWPKTGVPWWQSRRSVMNVKKMDCMGYE